MVIVLAYFYTLINFRVTRTLFVFAELTNLDPNYNGPSFNFDTIIRELIDQVEVGRLIYVNMVVRTQTFARIKLDQEKSPTSS